MLLLTIREDRKRMNRKLMKLLFDSEQTFQKDAVKAITDIFEG